MVDAHAIRIVYDGWVAPDAPEPRVIEVDGSTVEAAWKPLDDVLAGAVPVVALVGEALADHPPFRLQRVAAYAVIRRRRGRRSGAADAALGAGRTPGLGGRCPAAASTTASTPAVALAREVEEECGLDCEVGALLGVHDTHFSGTAPSGRIEDYHGVHLLFAATVRRTASRGWSRSTAPPTPSRGCRSDIVSGAVDVLDVVEHALGFVPVDRDLGAVRRLSVVGVARRCESERAHHEDDGRDAREKARTAVHACVPDREVVVM